MGKTDTPKPDNSAVVAAQASADAAKAQYALGEDQLRWAQTQWNQMQPLISRVTTTSADAQQLANEFARQQRAEYEKTFVPLEQSYVEDVGKWASPAQLEVNAGAAEARAGTAIEANRQAALEQLEGYGVDPTSTRYAGLDYGMGAVKGAAEAAAGTGAIQNTKLQGLGLKQQALQLGNQLVGNTTGLIGAGTGAGSGAAGAATSNLGAGSQAMTGSTAFTNAGTGAMNDFVNAVGGYNTAAEQGYATGASGASGLGSLAGTIFGALMPTNGIKGFDEGGPVWAYDDGGTAGVGVGASGSASPSMGVGAVGGAGMGVGGGRGGYSPGMAAIPSTFADWPGPNPSGYPTGWGPQRNLWAPNPNYNWPSIVSKFRGMQGAIPSAPSAAMFPMGAAPPQLALPTYGQPTINRFADGGPTEATPGGTVPNGASPSNGQGSDDVSARLTAGEFVMPKDVVNWYGQKHFLGQIDKARQDQAQLSQRRDVGGRPTAAIPAAPAFVSRPAIPPQAMPPQRAIPMRAA